MLGSWLLSEEINAGPDARRRTCPNRFLMSVESAFFFPVKDVEPVGARKVRDRE